MLIGWLVVRETDSDNHLEVCWLSRTSSISASFLISLTVCHCRSFNFIFNGEESSLSPAPKLI